MADDLLRLTDVNSFYGEAQVHFDLSLHVGHGELVCLLGGNASGKSSTMKAILGLLRPASGTITFDGLAITGLRTPAIVARGIGSVPEARRLFPDMTVRENLMMGAYRRTDRAVVGTDLARMLDLFPRLGERLSQRAGTLSGGEQQMVAMGRALMGRPRLLLMDEPTMGLSPRIVDKVLDLVAAINRQGIAILMVEQNAGLALGIARRAYVLRGGRIVLEGAAAEMLRDPRIRAAYLGVEPDAGPPALL